MLLLNIFYVVLIFSLGDTVFAGLNQNEPRIILGSPARLGQFPYQVSINKKKSNSFCGGSIIDKKHIVTAAHCVNELKKREKIQVWTGSLAVQIGGAYKDVKNIFIHEKYNSKTQDNDIAVLRLGSPFIFNNITGPITLPSGNISEGANCTVSGWGNTQPKSNKARNLLYADVQIYNFKTCAAHYAPYNVTLTKNMVCAGLNGRDACQGDSGGPLACKIHVNGTQTTTSLVGIVSFGIGCGNLYFPGVYTNVYPYVDWIKIQQKRNSSYSLSVNGMQPVAILIACIVYSVLF